MWTEVAAAWVQAIGSILAIVATGLFIRYQHNLERKARAAENRVRGLGLAADLDLVVLARISGRLDFAPESGDEPLTTDSACAQLSVLDAEIESIRAGAREAFLFGSPTADEIVLLGLEAARYQGIIDKWAIKLDVDATTFLERIKPSIASLSGRVSRVRSLIRAFLPKEGDIPQPSNIG